MDSDASDWVLFQLGWTSPNEIETFTSIRGECHVARRYRLYRLDLGGRDLTWRADQDLVLCQVALHAL